MDPSTTVAIIGKPNVGKSTLFNRLIGKRQAIVYDKAGTTRDRLIQEYDCNGFPVLLVDTGGLEYGKLDNIEENIQAQAKMAIDDADIIVFMINGAENLTTDDFVAADILRRAKKPIILVANKADNPKIDDNIFNIYELGFGEPIKISAIHKIGVDTFLHHLEEQIKKTIKKEPKKKKTKETKNTINLCILGKPNAGKSSYINALVGKEHVIVSDIPGTTRDSVNVKIDYQDHTFNLIDTAGLRRPGKRQEQLEKFSSLRCINAIEQSDIVILMIDAIKGITAQDTHIASLVIQAKKGMILVINKTDLFENPEKQKISLLNRLKQRFSFTPWAPVIFISAKNKTNINKVLELAVDIKSEREKKLKTAELNSFLQKITYKHLPSSSKVKKPKFLFINQVENNPPKFVMFFKNSKNLHFSYPRYLENKLREEYGFNGTSIILKFKEKATNEKI